MAECHDGSTVRTADKLSEGDDVTVIVNARAANHLDGHKFEATVKDVLLSDVVFEPKNDIEGQEVDTHTWYSDIGYIHGTHLGLERYSDIGKVREVIIHD